MLFKVEHPELTEDRRYPIPKHIKKQQFGTFLLLWHHILSHLPDLLLHNSRDILIRFEFAQIAMFFLAEGVVNEVDGRLVAQGFEVGVGSALREIAVGGALQGLLLAVVLH